MASQDIYLSHINDPTPSDVALIVGDKKVHAHREILSRRSRYFDKMFNGNFKEKDEKQIELSEDDHPEGVMAVIRFLYDQEYLTDAPKDRNGHTKLLEDSKWSPYGQRVLQLVQIFIVADKYSVQDLSAHLCARIQGVLRVRTLRDVDLENPDDVWATDYDAEATYDPDHAADLCEAIELLCGFFGDRALRPKDLFLMHCVIEFKALSKSERFMASLSIEGFRSALLSHKDLHNALTNPLIWDCTKGCVGDRAICPELHASGKDVRPTLDIDDGRLHGHCSECRAQVVMICSRCGREISEMRFR